MKKTHRVLIVGVGSIGERHLRCFRNSGRAEVSFCEPNTAFRTRVSETYGVTGFVSLDEALEKGEFDSAVICTPAPTHIPIALRLLGEGKHLLIEKPLSVSLEGTGELREKAEASGLVVRVAYVHRCFLPFMRAEEILRSGVYGKAKHVVVATGQHFPTFRPAYRDIYYARRESGGGAIQDALTHLINVAEWLVGPIRDLACQSAHQVLEGVNVEDTVNLIAGHESGVLSSFSLNQFQAPNENTLSIHCEKGSIRAETHARRVGEMALGENEWRWQEFPVEERDAAFERQAHAFFDAMEGKPCHLSTLDEGIQTLRVNLAALESSDTGVAVKVSA